MKVALWATAEVVAKVPATVFIPQPKVESVLVRLTRLPGAGGRRRPRRPDAASCARPSASAARCCAARSPAPVGPEAFAAAGVDPQTRPEQLGVAQWGALTAAVAAHPVA